MAPSHFWHWSRMPIDPSTARTQFVVPALHKLNLYSPQAEHLLMGTAAVESNFTNFVQFGGGPARGMFQMEPATYHDLVDRFLATDAALNATVLSLAGAHPASFLSLTEDHLFAAAMARIKYHSVGHPLPDTLHDQSQHWWTYYNGRSPHGLKPKDYIAAWNSYCAALYPEVTS